MSEKELEAEGTRIIKELTRPKARVHLFARIIALARREIHKHIIDNPELADDSHAQDIIDKIMETIGATCEIIDDYEIGYREDFIYEEKILNAANNRKSGSIPAEHGNSSGINSSSSLHPSDAANNAQKRATIARRDDRNSRRDNRRTSDVPEPHPAAKPKPKRAKRPKPDGDTTTESGTAKLPKFKSPGKQYTDEQP